MRHVGVYIVLCVLLFGSIGFISYSDVQSTSIQTEKVDIPDQNVRTIAPVSDTSRAVTGVAQVPTWYNGDWWAYGRDWSIDLGASGQVTLHDNSVYTVSGHETVTEESGETYDVYNITVQTTTDYGDHQAISGSGSINVKNVGPVSFEINPDASSGDGWVLIKRDDLSMEKMFMHLHLNANLPPPYDAFAANIDLNVTLDPKDFEEDYDFPIQTGEHWHQNWTIDVYGNYHLEAPVSGYEDYSDTIDDSIQMDSNYWCNETVDVQNPHGGTSTAFLVDSYGTNVSSTPGGRQYWKYTPDYRWYHEWSFEDISLGDMGGEPAKINYIKTLILEYGTGSGSTFQGTIEDDPDIYSSIPGGKLHVYASAPAIVSMPQAKISVDTSDVDGRQTAVLTLPDATLGDTTPCDTDYGSFGIIIQSKSSPDDYVVRGIQLNDADLVAMSVSVDKSGLLLQGENLSFSYKYYNSQQSYIGTPYTIEFQVDGTTEQTYTPHGTYGSIGITPNELSGKFYWIARGGTHTISVVLDGNNTIAELNENNNIVSINVTCDSAPTGDFDMNKTTAYTGEIIDFNATNISDPDGDSYTVSWDFDGNGIVDKTGKHVSNSFTDGAPKSQGGKTYNVTMILEDDKGAVASYSKKVSIYNRIPTLQMKITFSVNDNNVEYTDFNDTIIVPPNTEVTFSAEGSSDPDGTIIQYEWKIDGEVKSTDETFTYEWYEETKDMTCTLKAIDDDHEESAVITFTLRASNLLPIVSVSADKTEVMTGEVVTFTPTVSDLDGNIQQVWWDFDLDSDYDGDGIKDNDYESMENGVVTHIYTKGADGGKVYRVKLSAKDNDQGISSAIIEIRVFNRAPIAHLADLGTAYKDSEFTFDASGSYDPEDDVDNNGAIDGDEVNTLQYNIDFGDGSSSGWVSHPIIKYTYTTAGTYNGTLSVKDSDGNVTSLDFQITVKAVNHAPVINSFVVPESANENQPVTITVSASDSDGQNLTYMIYYDGIAGSAWVTNTTFTKAFPAGKHTIKISVKDSLGKTTTSEEKTITIKKANAGDENKSSGSSSYLIPIIVVLVILAAAGVGAFFFMKSKGKNNPPGGNRQQGENTPRAQQGQVVQGPVGQQYTPPSQRPPQ